MKRAIYKLHPALVAKPKRHPRSLLHPTDPPFLQQGDLDGACGIYTVWLALLIFGVSGSKAVGSSKVFKRPELKKAWRKSVERFMVGLDEGDMCDLLNTLRRVLHFKEVSASIHAVADFALESLDNSALVILGFETATGDGHWMLAVGIEGWQSGSRFLPTAILCIDCQEPAPTLAPFNVRVTLNAINSGAKYAQYHSSSGERQNVTLDSAFAITKRK